MTSSAARILQMPQPALKPTAQASSSFAGLVKSAQDQINNPEISPAKRETLLQFLEEHAPYY